MNFYFVVALTVLNHIAYKGSKMLMALYAIEFGATPFQIGMLFALYAVFSLFIAIHAGRLSDRFGPRVLMMIGCAGLGGGLLLPFVWPRLGMLYVSVTLVGALRKTGGKRGVATLCIGGGEAVAMAIEMV